MPLVLIPDMRVWCSCLGEMGPPRESKRAFGGGRRSEFGLAAGTKGGVISGRGQGELSLD